MARKACVIGYVVISKRDGLHVGETVYETQGEAESIAKRLNTLNSTTAFAIRAITAE